MIIRDAEFTSVISKLSDSQQAKREEEVFFKGILGCVN
jgi:hypothetical protein